METRMLLAELKTRLHYDPQTGVWTWLCGPRKGLRAGSRHQKGYRRIYLDGREYFEHRLAVFYMTGRWPIDQVDHREIEARDDNRWGNLREATPAQNVAHRRKPKNNTSGAKNVFWDKEKQRWAVRVKQRRFGYYACFDTARLVAAQAAQSQFGDFAEVQGAQL